MLLAVVLAAALNCSDALNQRDLDACTARAAAADDAREERAYQAMLTAAAPDLRPALRRAETAWRAYREAECRAEMGRYAGGSIAPTEYSVCRSALAEERMRRLREQRKP